MRSRGRLRRGMWCYMGRGCLRCNVRRSDLRRGLSRGGLRRCRMRGLLLRHRTAKRGFETLCHLCEVLIAGGRRV